MILQPIFGPLFKEEQVVTLEEPMYIPPNHYLGIYQRQFQPKIQFKDKWLRDEPVKFDVYSGLPQGAHPTNVGDVVHRMSKLDECTGMTFVVKHFDTYEESKMWLKEYVENRKNEKEEKNNEMKQEDKKRNEDVRPQHRTFDSSDDSDECNSLYGH